MSEAGKKIIDGLREAVAIAKGEVEPARVRYPPLISDAVVEAALDAKRNYYALQDDTGEWEEVREMIRAAILADRAETVERCAIAARIHSQYPVTDLFDRGYDRGRKDAAKAVRALSLSPSPSPKSASTAQEGGSVE